MHWTKRDPERWKRRFALWPTTVNNCWVFLEWYEQRWTGRLNNIDGSRIYVRRFPEK